MSGAADPRQELLTLVPKLRAFAMSLCGKPDRADDLVQETLMKAWAKMSSFQPGTSMIAWLYTILRNEFYTEYRRHRREVPDADGVFAARLTTRATQDGQLEFQDFRAALFSLPADQREALVLIGASGLSYEEAARICGCPVGTVKSRVNRGRAKLAELLTPSAPDEKETAQPAWRAAAAAG
jgi:RNA polymerase sigma-70 factor (ECF subfamily)